MTFVQNFVKLVLPRVYLLLALLKHSFQERKKKTTLIFNLTCRFEKSRLKIQ